MREKRFSRKEEKKQETPETDNWKKIIKGD